MCVENVSCVNIWEPRTALLRVCTQVMHFQTSPLNNILPFPSIFWHVDRLILPTKTSFGPSCAVITNCCDFFGNFQFLNLCTRKILNWVRPICCSAIKTILTLCHYFKIISILHLDLSTRTQPINSFNSVPISSVAWEWASQIWQHHCTAWFKSLMCTSSRTKCSLVFLSFGLS